MKIQHKLKDEKVSTECTWGDGPDVILHIERSQQQIDTWGSSFVPLDLTAKEAIRLGNCLVSDGERALELEQLATEHESDCE